MTTTIKYSRSPMGYDVSGRRYSSNLPTGGQQPQQRFPAHARSMESAPTGSSPIRVFEPNGKSQWALYHRDAWRPLEAFKDAGGVTRWRMSDGGFINNPIAWTSS